jgi:hypothetical protein
MFAYPPDRLPSDCAGPAVSGETNLIIPVSAGEDAVGCWRERLDPSAADGAPAHITVLGPFLDLDSIGSDELRRLRDLFAAFAPIRFSLARVDRFPGVLFLAPDPPAPFVALTEAVWRRWPQCPPYRGAYDEVIPHMTVAMGDGDFADVERALRPMLPISATADEVWLIARGEDGRWVCERSFGLGSQLR